MISIGSDDIKLSQQAPQSTHRSGKVDLMGAVSAELTTITSGNSAKTTDKRNVYLKHAMKSKETNPVF